jgi:hypothetical protein
MTKRTRSTKKHLDEPVASPEGPPIVHSSVYLPAKVHEALREVAFRERVKIHDVIMEGIQAVLHQRGYRKLRPPARSRRRTSSIRLAHG